MMRIRRSDDRGLADHGWLKSRHTFSFGSYHDPEYVGHGPLRVINEDRVEPGEGFGRHSHNDMEILSWVLEGALRHEDSLGTSAVIRPGEMQRMTAGTGITHSEMNDSSSAKVHFLQIWIIPATEDLKPGYAERAFKDDELSNRLCLTASGDGRDGSVLVHQDVDLYVARLDPGMQVNHRMAPGRLGWIQVARGSVELNGQPLEEGDGAALEGISELSIKGRVTAEALLFDMGP